MQIVWEGKVGAWEREKKKKAAEKGQVIKPDTTVGNWVYSPWGTLEP